MKPGESQIVEFTLQPRQFSIINSKGNRVIEPGIFQVFVGGEQPEMKGRLDAPNTQVLSASFKVKGKEIQLSH